MVEPAGKISSTDCSQRPPGQLVCIRRNVFAFGAFADIPRHESKTSLSSRLICGGVCIGISFDTETFNWVEV
jgi:hypothetical protein